MTRYLLLAFVCCAGLTAPAFAQEEANQELVDAIRKHGLEQSQAMELAG